MEIDFDPGKDVANITKHGVSLVDATRIEWDTLRAVRDERSDYSEARMIGYALIGVRLYCVVYTDRDEKRRVISLRKANKREVRAYVHKN